MRFYLIFRRTVDVMMADEWLSKNNVSYKIVPVPKEISGECGLCVLTEEPWEKVLSLIKDAKPVAVYDGRMRLVWRSDIS